MQGSCLVWQNYLRHVKMAETNRKFDCSWNIRFPIDWLSCTYIMKTNVMRDVALSWITLLHHGKGLDAFKDIFIYIFFNNINNLIILFKLSFGWASFWIFRTTVLYKYSFSFDKILCFAGVPVGIQARKKKIMLFYKILRPLVVERQLLSERRSTMTKSPHQLLLKNWEFPEKCIRIDPLLTFVLMGKKKGFMNVISHISLFWFCQTTLQNEHQL